MSETVLFWTTLNRKITVYTGEEELSGLRAKNTRDGLAKQKQADSYMWATVKL